MINKVLTQTKRMLVQTYENDCLKLKMKFSQIRYVFEYSKLLFFVGLSCVT